ncbi:unnamed protein product, partial [Brenthis ino]
MHVAAELRKYDPITLARVKHSINTIIFDADMACINQLNQSTIQENDERRPDPDFEPLLEENPMVYDDAATKGIDLDASIDDLKNNETVSQAAEPNHQVTPSASNSRTNKAKENYNGN